MKTFLSGKLLWLFTILFPDLLLAQSPDSLWTSCFGGSGNEVVGLNSPNNFGNNMASVAFDALDGSSYIATCTASPGIYGRLNAGVDDVLIIHLAQNGDTLWTKVLGGSGSDRAYRARSVSNGGIIVAGYTSSNDGYFSGNPGGYAGFLLRINAAGQIIWNKMYGGSSNDYLYDVVENPAGNFVACGESISTDGDLAGAGNGLAWVIFVNGTSGNAAFSVAPVGPNGSSANGLENFTVIKRLNDGSGYLLSGFTSPDFNNPNLDDIWVSKMTFTGATLWNKTFGSNNGRDGSGAIIDLGNGEFMVAGILAGNGGYPAYRGGPGDGFLIRCNSSGDSLWTKSYGGSDWDFFHDAVMDNDSNIYLAGFSRSSDQQLAGQTAFGLADYWIVKVNLLGDTLYTLRIGGNDFDAATGIACNGTQDELLVAGRSNSTSGWVNGNNGQRDIWAVRLSNPLTGTIAKSAAINKVRPNPFRDQLTISNVKEAISLIIRDTGGREVFRSHVCPAENQIINIPSSLSSGLYLVELLSNENRSTQLMIKQ